MTKVAEFFHKGFNPTQIAKETGLARKKVLDLIDDWKKWAQQDQDVMARARETLALVDTHYGMLIKELWETIEQADQNNNLVVKVNAIKALGEMEAKRAQIFQSAGLNDQGALAEDIAETQRRQQILGDTLREVTAQCPHCKIETRKRLALAFGRTEVIDIGQPEIEQ